MLRSFAFFKCQPINPALNLLQRRNKRHLTPTKQCIATPKHIHFKSPREHIIHPHATPIDYIRLNTQYHGKMYFDRLMR